MEQTAPESHEGSHEVGPVRPGNGEPVTQLSGREALEQPWASFYDLIPESEAPFLHSDDGRTPLDFKRLRDFLISCDIDVPGLDRDQRLCTALPNGPEAAVCFLAFSLRYAFAPLNLGLSAEEFAFEYEDLPAAALVVQKSETLTEEWRRQSDLALAVACKASIDKLLVLTPSTLVAGLFDLSPHKSGRQVPCGRSPGSQDPVAAVCREDLALVLHTSGTTKKPKVVPLTHCNIACGALCIASTTKVRSEDLCLNSMPLFHIHGLIVNVLASLVSQAQLTCLPGNFFAPAFFKSLNTVPHPTWYSAVPTMHLQVLQQASSVSADASSTNMSHLQLVRNCSAALLPSVAEALEERLGAIVMPTYAMTESMPIASNPRYGTRKLRSVGPAVGPDLAVMGHDEATVLSVGEEGEVVVRGGPVTAGYELRAHMGVDPNREAFSGEWLRTGDKGWFDADGYLYLSGRFKELINRAGEKISPFEIEDVVRGHESLADCVAFAAPHASLGEVVGVAVVLTAGQKLTLRGLRSWILKQERIQSKWLPEAYVVMPSLPKGPTGKPQRIGLAQRFEMQPLEGMPREWTHPGF